MKTSICAAVLLAAVTAVTAAGAHAEDACDPVFAPFKGPTWKCFEGTSGYSEIVESGQEVLPYYYYSTQGKTARHGWRDDGVAFRDTSGVFTRCIWRGYKTALGWGGKWEKRWWCSPAISWEGGY